MACTIFLSFPIFAQICPFVEQKKMPYLIQDAARNFVPILKIFCISQNLAKLEKITTNLQWTSH